MGLFSKSSLVVKSHAKINVSLKILGTKEDGYHDLEMVNLPLDLHDIIEISKAPFSPDTFVTCDDASLNFSRHNLCTKTIEQMREVYGFKDNFVVDIHKEIPYAAGLGGGSSNAAAVMKAIYELLKIQHTPDEVLDIGLKIGADVPFFVSLKPAIVRGVGEKIQTLGINRQYLCLLVKPNEGLSTKTVFAKYDEMKPEPATIDTNAAVECLQKGDLKTLGKVIGNDLMPASMSLLPEIGNIIESLKKDGFDCVSMTGSGSTVFALTTDMKKAKSAFRKYDDLGYVTRLTWTLA